MTVEASVWLFGKPSDEMNIEGGKATPKMLREKGAELKGRLERAAEILEKLDANGWSMAEVYGSVYSLDFYKDVSLEEAKRELKGLGIGPEEMSLRELEEEEVEE
jgi:hypothetical protein